ncbi:MAG: hypothetical protein AB8H80_00580 [Planctomycetota bacterium]
MNHIHSLALGTAALAASTGLLAQTFSGNGFAQTTDQALGPQAHFRRSAIVDLDDSKLPDLVQIAQQNLWVHFEPGRLVAKSLAIAGCIDFDVRAATPIHPAQIVAADPSGLHLIHIAPDPQSAVVGAQKFVQTTILTAPQNQNSLVRVRDVTGDGLEDLVAYDANTDTFVALIANASNGWMLLPIGSGNGDTVLDFEVYSPDGANSRIAAMTATGIRVIDQLGDEVFATVQTDLAANSMCIVDHGGAIGWLTWLCTNTTTGLQELHLLAPTGSQKHTLPAAIEATSMVAGDLNADDLDDLVLNLPDTFELAFVPNLGSATAPSFQPTQTLEIHGIPYLSNDPAHANPANGARPAITDVDNDGDEDVVMAHDDSFENNRPETGKNIYVWRNNLVDATPNQVHLQNPSGGSTIDLPLYEGAEYVMTLPLEANNNVGATHIETTVWRKADPASDLDGDVFFKAHTELATSNGSNAYSIPVSLGPVDPATSQQIWMWSQRMIQKDTTGDVVEVWPAKNYAVGIYTPASPVAAFLAAFGIQGGETLRLVPASATGAFFVLGNAEPPGGGLPVECTGNHPDEIPPKPPASDSNGNGG